MKSNTNDVELQTDFDNLIQIEDMSTEGPAFLYESSISRNHPLKGNKFNGICTTLHNKRKTPKNAYFYMLANADQKRSKDAPTTLILNETPQKLRDMQVLKQSLPATKNSLNKVKSEQVLPKIHASGVACAPAGNAANPIRNFSKPSHVTLRRKISVVPSVRAFVRGRSIDKFSVAKVKSEGLKPRKELIQQFALILGQAQALPTITSIKQNVSECNRKHIEEGKTYKCRFERHIKLKGKAMEQVENEKNRLIRLPTVSPWVKKEERSEDEFEVFKNYDV